MFERISTWAVIVLGILLSVAGVVGFVRTGRWVGLIGAVVFALGTLYLFYIRDRN
jgi:uncharacterized membrane protein (UPF0136 family)